MQYELRHLRYFIAVAEELHFRRAAERLNLAQPALSRAIQQLEQIIGTSLLERNNRQVTLTAAGKVFLKESYKTLDGVNNSADRALRAASGHNGHLIIGYTDFAINGTLPELINGFNQQHPDVTLELKHGFTEQQLSGLRNNLIDIGFLTGPLRDPGLAQVNIQADKFVAVLPNGHPLARKPQIRLRDLQDEDFITGNAEEWSHFRRHLDALCLEAGFSPRITQEAHNSEGIFGLIAAGMGVTIHLACMENYHRKGTILKEISDTGRMLPSLAVWNKNNIPPARQRFVDFLNGLTPGPTPGPI